MLDPTTSSRVRYPPDGVPFLVRIEKVQGERQKAGWRQETDPGVEECESIFLC